MPTKDMAEMLEVVSNHNHNGWLVGNSRAVVIAESWMMFGFSPEEADRWLEVGCFNPSSAKMLKEKGWTPEEASQEWGNSGMSVAYASTDPEINHSVFDKKELV